MIRDGHVLIELSRAVPRRVDIMLDLPGDISGLLRGKTPDRVLDLIPALYSVCGIAQSHAAVTALEMASEIPVATSTAQCRQALTAMETLREHGLRIALDWPFFLHATADAAQIRALMPMTGLLSDCLFEAGQAFRLGAKARPAINDAEKIIGAAETLLEDLIFGEPLDTWKTRTDWKAILDWAGGGATVAARLISFVASAGWLAVGSGVLRPFDSVSASSASEIDALGPAGTDKMPETTVLARTIHHPLFSGKTCHGLASRLVARLVELAHLPPQIRALVNGAAHLPNPQTPTRKNFGIAMIEAARGTLIHAVHLKEGRIADYRIIPPTYWNFGTNGVAARCLTDLVADSDDALMRQAQLIVNAIDPCVAHDVRLC